MSSFQIPKSTKVNEYRTNRIIHNVSFLWLDQKILKRKKYTKNNNIFHTTDGQQIPVKYSTEDE